MSRAHGKSGFDNLSTAAHVSLANLDAGANIYKNENPPSNYNLRSLVNGAGIAVTEQADNISIANTAPESTTVLNLGPGTGIFAQMGSTQIQLKSLIQGAGINISTTATDITISNTAPLIPTRKQLFLSPEIFSWDDVNQPGVEAAIGRIFYAAPSNRRVFPAWKMGVGAKLGAMVTCPFTWTLDNINATLYWISLVDDAVNAVLWSLGLYTARWGDDPDDLSALLDMRQLPSSNIQMISDPIYAEIPAGVPAIENALYVTIERTIADAVFTQDIYLLGIKLEMVSL